MAEAARFQAGWIVVALTAEQTHPIRRAVLRADTPSTDVAFAEDALPDTIHLGVLHATDDSGGDGDIGGDVGGDGARLVATSTWFPREFAGAPGRRAIQLRGMATLHEWQGCGVGAALLRAGLAHARETGAELVWANARDTALGFYLRHGFDVHGDGFVDATTDLPHHVVVRAP